MKMSRVIQIGVTIECVTTDGVHRFTAEHKADVNKEFPYVLNELEHLEKMVRTEAIEDIEEMVRHREQLEKIGWVLQPIQTSKRGQR